MHGNGAGVRLGTRFGSVFLRYPSGRAPTVHAVHCGAQDIEVCSDAFSLGNPAQYEAAMMAILPLAIQRATANNTQQVQQRMN